MSIIRNEKQVYARLKARWPEAHWQRFETSIGSGVPDTNMAHPEYGDFWFECKVAKLGRHNTLTLNIRPKQRLWIKERLRAKGWVYLAWAYDKQVFLTHGRWLEKVDNKEDARTWFSISTELKRFTLGAGAA